MARKTYPIKQPGDILGAGHVNALSAAAKLTDNQPGSFTYGTDNAIDVQAPFYQRAVIVVQIGEPLVSSSSSSSSKSSSSISSSSGLDVPLRRSDLVLVRPLYYDSTADRWKTDDEEGPYELDIGVLGLSVDVDEILTAYWDPQRDAFVPVSGVGGAGVKVLFEIRDVFFLLSFCFVSAEVMARPCGSMKVADEDDNEEIRVYDLHGCLFNEPPGDLVNRVGTAVRVEVKEGAEVGDCGNIPEKTCLWMVDSLCCPTCPDV